MAKAVFTNAGLVLASCFFCFFLLEAGLRLRQTRQGIPFFESSADFVDPVLGWKGRLVETPAIERRPRILFLGDSFTDGLGVPDDKLYFSVAARALGVNAAAYGGKGYGTLQEALALKELRPKLRPDLIIVQLCANDFLNNSWELETQSYMQNALLPRPYLIGGEMEVLYPRSFPALRVALDSHSRLFHVAFMRGEIYLHGLAMKKRLVSIEDKIVGSKGELPEFRRAVETTGEIFGMLLNEAKGVPILAFESDEIPPYHPAFAGLAAERGIQLFGGVSSAIMDAEKARRKVRQADNVHWNEEGHAIAGSVLAEEIQRLHGEALRR